MKLGKQYKIWVGCPEASEIVQRHAFKLGQSWSDGTSKVLFTEYKWLTFWNDGKICYSTQGLDIFMGNDFTEISIADFLKIQPAEEGKYPEMDAYLNNHLFGDGLCDPHLAIEELHERIMKLEEAQNA